MKDLWSSVWSARGTYWTQSGVTEMGILPVMIFIETFIIISFPQAPGWGLGCKEEQDMNSSLQVCNVSSSELLEMHIPWEGKYTPIQFSAGVSAPQILPSAHWRLLNSLAMPGEGRCQKAQKKRNWEATKDTYHLQTWILSFTLSFQEECKIKTKVH